MGVAEFEAEYERGKTIVNTMYQGIWEALVSFGNALVGADNLVDFKKLSAVASRKAANDNFMNVLKTNAVAYFASSLPAGADYKAEQLVIGLYGVPAEMLPSYLERAQDKATSPLLFREITSENRVFGYMENQSIKARPRSKLTLDDTAAVMAKIGTEAAKVKPANIKNSDELAEILEQYLNEKGLTETFLAGKNYKA